MIWLHISYLEFWKSAIHYLQVPAASIFLCLPASLPFSAYSTATLEILEILISSRFVQ